MTGSLYDTLRWRRVRAQAIARDKGRCSVASVLGGACSEGPPHVHHLIPVSRGGAEFDVANLITSCSSHHPQVEALRRAVMERREPARPRCPHQHRSRAAREQCERRLARERGLQVA